MTHSMVLSSAAFLLLTFLWKILFLLCVFKLNNFIVCSTVEVS